MMGCRHFPTRYSATECNPVQLVENDGNELNTHVGFCGAGVIGLRRMAMWLYNLERTSILWKS